MRFVTPVAGHRFIIPSNGDMPPLIFTTDAEGPHDWDWSISWRNFRKQGHLKTQGASTDLAPVLTDLGGELRVIARTGKQRTAIQTSILGTNPTEAEIRTYLATKTGGTDFLPIVLQEAHGRHFNRKREPIVSFDGGYGMTQLTNPVPTYQQIWSWKRNLEGGLALFAVKRNEAIRALRQSGGSYTAHQLTLESVARWNGGAYHRRDGRNWVRNLDILCAPGTGNIGWDMTDTANQGQTLQQLHARDSSRFHLPPRRGVDHYRYSGVCYADRLVP